MIAIRARTEEIRVEQTVGQNTALLDTVFASFRLLSVVEHHKTLLEVVLAKHMPGIVAFGRLGQITMIIKRKTISLAPENSPYEPDLNKHQSADTGRENNTKHNPSSKAQIH